MVRVKMVPKAYWAGSAAVARQFVLAALLVVMVFGFSAPRARAEAVVGPASVVSVTVTVGPAGETHVRLNFNQLLPQFSIVSNDVERPVLGFADTVRGAGAGVPTGVHGLIKDVQFDQRDTVLTMTLLGLGPIHVEAKPIAGHAVDLVLTQARGGGDAVDNKPVGALPSHVDRGPGDDVFEVVPLKFADISEVVGLLSAGQPIKPNDNFTPQEPAFGSSGISNNGTPNNLAQQNYLASQQDTPANAMGQMVDDSIGVDRRLNAIILHGPSERVARLKEQIAALDVAVHSVLLETVFVELTETGARNLGFEFNNTSGQVGVVTYQQGAFVNSLGGQGFGGPGYGSYALQAALFAQVSKGEGRIISRPRISAQSGSSAKIITGDALPILTSIALSGVNAVSQQVQYVNVGVTLQIAPRVGADGYVTSHIFAEVSSVTGYSQGYPTISQREASTSATVKDGEYFVIGGLTQENHLTTKSRVPGFGDLPGVGALFKLHQETGNKTELYIVVTPHVVTDADTQTARAEAVK